MVVPPGVAITEKLVVVLSPVPGDQEYVLAPLAVSVVDWPEQIVVEVGDTLTVGNGFTVTVQVNLEEQPLEFVPVTV